MHLRSAVVSAICTVGLLIAAVPEAHGQLSGSQRGVTYQFDVRQAKGRTDRLGLDFDVHFTSQQEPAASSFRGYGVTARVTGFTSFDRATRDVNALSVEAALQGWKYSTELLDRPLTPEEVIERISLLEKVGAGTKLTARETSRLNGFLDRLGRKRKYWTYAATYQLETTQDVTITQHALGAKVSVELPRLGNLLDCLPARTRADTGANDKTFPVRALFAVDYVRPGANAANNAALLDTASWRARTEMAWSSVVLDRYVLRVSWEAHYFINPPSSVTDADRRFNNFLQAWIKVPLTAETGVFVKYLSGRLPPTYADAKVSALGLNISFF